MHMPKKEKSKKRSLRARHYLLRDLLFILMLAAVLFTMLWFMVSSKSFMLFGNIVTHVETSEKVVALTFDDGPLPGATEETLKTLKQLDVKATFFTIGLESKRHPEQLKEIIAAGQEVGNHSYSHKLMAFMTYDQVAREIERNDALIRDAGYTGSIPFRVPYNVKFIALPYYLSRHERPDISHNVMTSEGWKYSSKKITDSIVGQVTPGSIILLHPMYKHTVSSREAIRPIVDALRAKGYSFVTVSQLLTYKKS